jgi:hypothetical protein
MSCSTVTPTNTKYESTAGTCSTCRTCTATQYEALACSATANRECPECQVCTEGPIAGHASLVGCPPPSALWLAGVCAPTRCPHPTSAAAAATTMPPPSMALPRSRGRRATWAPPLRTPPPRPWAWHGAPSAGACWRGRPRQRWMAATGAATTTLRMQMQTTCPAGAPCGQARVPCGPAPAGIRAW